MTNVTLYSVLTLYKEEVQTVILAKLATVRKGKNMTQKQLADVLLFSERTVIAWEGGRPATENNARRIAAVLGVKVAELQ